MCSIAALESSINEFVFGREKDINRLDDPQYSDAIRKKYSRMKGAMFDEILTDTNIISKYNALWFLFKHEFMKENNLLQDVRYLFCIRNSLTHFTPEFDDALYLHLEIERGVKNRFAPSPFFAPGGIFFPRRCLSASCAAFAEKTARDFLNYFWSNIR